MVGGGSTSVVGREAELSLLENAFRASHSRQGSAICLTGAAGIGKTLLLRTALQHAHRLGVATASTWCVAEGAPPLWPWLDLLAQLDALPGDGSELAAEGLPAFRRVERAVAEVAGRAPLLIAIDDLHHADEATTLLTRYLAARISSVGVVLLLTHRTVESATATAHDSRLLTEIDRTCDVVSLPPLLSVSIAELATAHGHPALPPAVIDALTVASGGIPLYATAALDACPPGTLQLDLVTELQVSVLSRLRTLPVDDAAIMARAAVLGRVVRADIVAQVCGIAPAKVAMAAWAARSANLIRPGGRDTIDFGHDLVREAIRGWLDSADVADTHAAAAALYQAASSSGPADLVRAARHALQAANRSKADATRAVTLGQSAAAVLAHGGALEDAESLLEQTLTANNLAGQPISQTRLLIERASAVLLAGRLSEAHDRYNDATVAALAERDNVALAEAAAGLGSLWANSVRALPEQRRILRIQRSALAQLPPGPDSLHLRLRARIAAEAMFWEGAGPEPLLEVLADLQHFHDPATVLEVLSVAHNPLLGPQHNDLRISLSEQMLTSAAESPGRILPLMALCWHTVNLFLAGDARSERALADLRDGAETTQTLSVLYVVRVIEVMLMICRGQLAQAEEAATAAFELGNRAQDADAMSYLGGHLVAIRWFQGREGEMLDLVLGIVNSPNIDVVDHSFEAAIAALAARAGNHDVARRYLNQVKGTHLRTLPRLSTWLMTVVTVIEAAIELHDQSTVAEAYELLEPFGALPVAPSLAVVNFGCAHHWLGTAAIALGRPESAEQHLRAAVDTNLRLGHAPATAVSRAELANLLIAHRPTRQRTEEAHTLFTTALAAARDLGMDALADRWSSTADQLGRPAILLITRDDKSDEGAWIVDFAGRRAVVRNLTGIRMLATLIASPGHWIPASHLVSGLQPAPYLDRYPVLDATARRTLESRVRELAAIVAEFRSQGDSIAQTAAEEEMDAIAEQLSSAAGFAGRPRNFMDEAERARTSVRKAIVRAIKEIEHSVPTAAAHLRDHITTGASCRYLS